MVALPVLVDIPGWNGGMRVVRHECRRYTLGILF